MTKTGVFATPVEVESLKSRLNTPLIMLQCGPIEMPAEMAHKLALAHGLPEISGHYGIDLQTGEFLSV